MTTAFTITQRAELARLAEKGNEQFERAYKDIYAGGKYSSINSNTAYEQLARYAPLGVSIPRVADKARATPQLISLEPKVRTFRHESFRAGYTYLWEDFIDDKWGFFKEQAAGLGELMDFTLELLGHEAFNRFNDATFTSGWDNLPLGHANHLLLDGGTYSNLLTAAPPSETLYENILNALDAIPDDFGRLTRANSHKLVVHRTRFRAWDQLFKTPTAVVETPGVTIASGVNPNQGIPSRFRADYAGTQLIGTRYFNQPGLVAALADNHELVWIDRLAPKQDMLDRKDPPAVMHRIWYKGSRGWMDARRIVIVQPS